MVCFIICACQEYVNSQPNADLLIKLIQYADNVTNIFIQV